MIRSIDRSIEHAVLYDIDNGKYRRIFAWSANDITNNGSEQTRRTFRNYINLSYRVYPYIYIYTFLHVTYCIYTCMYRYSYIGMYNAQWCVLYVHAYCNIGNIYMSSYTHNLYQWNTCAYNIRVKFTLDACAIFAIYRLTAYFLERDYRYFYTSFLSYTRHSVTHEHAHCTRYATYIARMYEKTLTNGDR